MREETPLTRLLEINDGYVLARALQLVAELRVADLLADGPCAVADLAAATSTHPHALHRVLRALASAGVFTEDDTGRYGLTPVGECLRDGASGSARSWSAFDGMITFRAFADAMYSLRTGKPAFDRVFGEPFFDYLEQHRERGDLFDHAMAELSRDVATAIVDAYDFGAARRIVDVGGGDGTLLTAVLRACPNATGVLFDVPRVAAAGRGTITAAGLGDRCRVEGGDFFVSVPAGGDLYLLKWVIHDWGDERAATILRNCRKAIGPDGRLLLIEQVIPAGDDPHPGKILDLVMLVAVSGQERTEAEYAELLADSGFELSRVVVTDSPMDVVECIPT